MSVIFSMFFRFFIAIAICSLYMSASFKSCRLLKSGFDGV